MPTTFDTRSLACATYAFPGPTMQSTRGMVAVPYAIAAIAPAPPTANTRSAFESSAAASVTAAGRPFGAGGEQMITSLTPATRAGIAPMRTLLGYDARPPGAYTPTRRSGSGRRPTTTPGSGEISTVCGRD